MSTPRRSRVLWAAAFVAALALFFAFSSSAFAADLIVGSTPCSFGSPGYATIQSAINAAAVGDSVKVCNGTYAENLVIGVGKNLAVIGESRAGVVLNPPALGSYGIDVQAANVTLKSFTLNGHGTGDTYGLKISGDAVIADVQDITVDNFYRSGFDFNGLNGLTLKNIISTNADWGVGVGLTDVSNAALENITTSGNVWGGIAIYTRSYHHPGSVTDSIVLQGVNSISEANPIFVELDPYDGSTLTFKPATNISLAGYPFMVTNTNGRNFFSFAKDAAGAAQIKTFQEVKFSPGKSSITQLAGAMSFWPTGYTVQAAIDAAAAGSTVVVGQGTFTEQLTINKKLTLIGSGPGTVIKSPATLATKFVRNSWGTPYDRKPIVFATGVDVAIKNLTVDGDSKGSANHMFYGIAYLNAGGSIENVEIKNIQDSSFSGAQHGVALYALVDDGSVRSLVVRGNTLRDFQKNGMAISADAASMLMLNVTGNKVFGKGATGVTAQNGIQIWKIGGTLKGVVEGNTISGIAYDDSVSNYVATSILNYYADLDILNNTITGAHMGIYNIDAPARINGNRLQIIRAGANARYGFGIIATDPPRAVPSPIDGPGTTARTGSVSADSAGPDVPVEISNNTVVFVGSLIADLANAFTTGIEGDAGYGVNDIVLTADGNTVTGFDYGFGFFKCVENPATSGADCSSGEFISITAHNNRIYGNRLFGMYNDAGNPPANATGNWWGSASGPTVVTGASAASPIPAAGDNVSGNVVFDPWTQNAVLTVVDNPYILTTPANTIVVPLRIAPPAANYSSVGFSVDYDQACLKIANPATDVTVLHADLEKSITNDAANGELKVALWDQDAIASATAPDFVFPAGNFMEVKFTLESTCNTANPVVVNFSAIPPASCGLQTGLPAADCATLGAALLVNYNPTDITLAPASINENAPSPYTVGTLSAVDADGGPTYTFTKVAGTGAEDNAAFVIVDNELRLTASPDFEDKPSYSVRVKVEDGRGGSYEKALTVTVNNMEEPPTDITLTNAVVAESASPGTVVGSFGIVDDDGPAGYSFAIVGGTGDPYFDIVGNELQVAAPLSAGTYTLIVQATGPGGLTISETFTITVEDTAYLSIADNLIVRKGSTIAVPVTYAANGNTATDLVFDVTYNAACLTFQGGANATSPSPGTVHVTLSGAPIASGDVTTLTFYAKKANEGCGGNRSDVDLTLVKVTYEKVVGPITILLALDLDSGKVILYKNSPRGDCNSNDVVEAGDFVAIVLEYFDVHPTLDPSSFWLDAPLFDFDGSPRGCDANASATIDTADVVCTVLVFFGDTTCTETGPLSAASANPVVLSMPGDLAVNPNQAIEVPVALESLGNDVAAVGFILQLDKSKVAFDATDGDGDGIPDSVNLNVPASLMRSVAYDAAAGQVKVAIADLTLPLATLADGTIATVTLSGVATGTTELQFVHASAGSTEGQSLTVIEKVGDGASSNGRAFLPSVRK